MIQSDRLIWILIHKQILQKIRENSRLWGLLGLLQFGHDIGVAEVQEDAHHDHHTVATEQHGLY